MPAEMHLASLDVFGRQVIEPAIIQARVPLSVEAFQSREIVPVEAARRARFRRVALGWTWGPAWSTCWFRLSGRVPAGGGWDPKATHVRFSSGTEALLWGPQGPAHGFDANRDRALLSLAVPTRGMSRGGARKGVVSLLLEAACNHPLGADGSPWGDDETKRRWASAKPGRLDAAELVLVSDEVERLWHAWSLAIDLARELLPPPPPITTHSERFPANLPWQDSRCEALLTGLREAHRLIAGTGNPHHARLTPTRTPSALPRSAPPPPPPLGAVDGGLRVHTIARAALRVLESALAQPPRGSATTCHAVGHAHIDTAWLWPIRETRRKCQRTFATVLALMDRYPDFRFVASQAQQYAWVEQDAPDLFRRIAERVAEGRWEPGGGMWIEPDCHIPSGESQVRQIVQGTRYWSSRFGTRGAQTYLYLPDTFGFPPCLPGIMMRAGLTTFITNKISWNESTPFPHTTFLWRGLDGSKVVTHFTPGNDYNATNSPRELRRGEANHRSLAVAAREPRTGTVEGGARWLQPFGFGDGGGGPTAGMIENAIRADPCEGLPRVRMDRVDEFCGALHADIGGAYGNGTTVPEWSGELYLERHRGTLTTQAWIKQANRQAEDDLRLAEGLLAGSPTPLKPRERAGAMANLDEAWELLLLNQFHDILPGSSIAAVYADARRDHARITAITRDLIDDGLARWARAMGDGGGTRPVMIFNPVSTRTVGEVAFSTEQGRASATRDRANRLIASAPGFGARVIDAAAARNAQHASTHGAGVTLRQHGSRSATLANDHLSATIDALGQVTSLRVPDDDGTLGPELAATPLNALVLHDDRPRAWDAWDIDDSHAWTIEFQRAPASRWRITAKSADRCAIEVTRPIGRASRVITTFSLSRGARRLEIAHRVDWHEQRRLLRVEFPLAVEAEHATFQTQFGRHTRPTRPNTSAEHAAFEVPIQRWIDVSDPRHGVAILNDRTFGGSARQVGPAYPGTIVALSLLRAPMWPDPTADRGIHTFRFAILPHEGPLAWANVDEEAEAMHRPLIAMPMPARSVKRSRRSPEAPTEWAPVEIESSQPSYVQISALKFAEDGRGTILRLVETAGAGDDIVVRWNIPARTVVETDLLERPRAARPASDFQHTSRGARAETRLTLRPFEILTLRASPAAR